jgi:hypothetical protein
LVIAEGADDIVTLWAMSGLRDLESARLNLQVREGAKSVDSIGYVTADAAHMAPIRGAGGAKDETDRLVQRLRTWMSEHHLDAVIWTDLRTNYLKETGDEPTPDNVVALLSTKLKPEERNRAEDYIRHAPRQIETALRKEIEVRLGWVALATSPIATVDDIRFKEWAECRTTIGRLDSILVDLRKTGFSFITALLGAGSFLSFLGLKTSTSGTLVPIEARTAIFLVTMVLIAALFWLDTYYETLLSGAVERCLDLEIQTEPPVRLAKYLSINVQHTGTVRVTLGIYMVLLGLATGLGVLALLASPTESMLPNGLNNSWGMIALIGIVGILTEIAMWRYWAYIAKMTRFDSLDSGRPWRPGESADEKKAAS